jgi:uncharacterized protein (TIGR04222 family)
MTAPGPGVAELGLPALMLALTGSAAGLRRWGFRGSPGLPVPAPERPCEIAFLAARSRRAAYGRTVAVAVLDLIDRGVLRARSAGAAPDERYVLALVHEQPPDHPLERAVYDAVAARHAGRLPALEARTVASMLRPLVAGIERRQRLAGFILSARQRVLIRVVPAALFLLGVLVPVAWAVRGGPTLEVLILSVPVDLLLVLVWVRRFLAAPRAHRTRRGEEVLAMVRRRHPSPARPALEVGLTGRDALTSRGGLWLLLGSMGVD